MTALLARSGILSLAFIAWLPGALAATEPHRHPRPDFESGYVFPELALPAPEPSLLATLDVVVLFALLALASWLALRARSRRGLALLTVASVLYFGFFREGCICAVGATQNVLLGLIDPGYAVPATVLAFFFLPLLFALLCGRTFCAGVCPLGGIQDLVVLWPRMIPRAVREALGLIPRLHLATIVVAVPLGLGFLICRYDPFVALFRLSGTAAMLLVGGAVLALGTVIARPYCRFFCPYGVLLGWTSRFSLTHSAITPAECVRCGLCEDACPFGAIRPPFEPASDGSLAVGKRRMALLLAALPALVALGVWLGAQLEGPLSLAHPTVQLAEEVFHSASPEEPTARLEAFRRSELPASVLFDEAAHTRQRLRSGGMVLGGFFGLFVGFRLIGLSLRRRRSIWEPDRGECLSCGRCFEACPIDHVHRHGSAGEYAELLERLEDGGDAST